MAEEQKFIDLCSSAGEEERLQGLKGLARLGIERFLPQLYKALGDDSWRLRKEAADLFLALPGSGDLAGEIIELLHSQDNAGLRNTAVDILGRLGRSALPHLLDELSCPDHDVRKFALDILGAIRAEEAIPGMLECLADSDSNVRAAAAENLGRMQVPVAVPDLLKAMVDADLMLRFTILEALAQIGAEVPVPELLAYSEEKLLRQALFDCLGHVGNASALPVLVEGLSDSMRNVREAACLALQRIAQRHAEAVQQALVDLRDDALGDALAEQLQSRRLEVRRGAIQLLGWCNNARTAAHLLPLLGEEDLSRDAARALISIGAESSCSLMELWPSADARTRSYLAYILGEARCSGCEDLLLEGLKDPLADLRQAAAHALGLVGGDGCPEALAAALVDSEPEVGGTLVQALSQVAIRSPRQVLSAVKGLMESPEETVRSQAVSILGSLRDPEVDDLLAMALKDVAADVRGAAIRACEGRESERQWEALLLALTDEESEVRRLAVEVIGNSGREEAGTALKLAMQDDDIWVRSASIRALVHSGLNESVALLTQALTDKVGLVVIAALEALWEIAPDKAYPESVALLAHPDEEVVNAALKQLTYAGRTEWISETGEGLLNHGNWEVRLAAARALAELDPAAALIILENRLPVEGEDLVRQQIRELIEALRASRG